MHTKDTQSPEAIIHALYKCISGPAGTVADWERERYLLHPTARLMRTALDDQGDPVITVMSAQEYQENTHQFFIDNDFFEVEIDRREWHFGNVAHVLSMYEARVKPDDAEPERRGVNSIQLYNDGQRWWVMSVLWDNERPGLKAHLDHS